MEQNGGVAAAKQSRIWKVHRVQQAACASWVVTGIAATAMLGLRSAALGASMGFLWLSWLAGCLCGLAGHRLCKPLAVNERLLGGLLGSLTALLSVSCNAPGQLRVYALLLGLSQMLVLSGCVHGHTLRVLRFWNLSEGEALKMLRRIPWPVMLGEAVLLLLCAGMVMYGADPLYCMLLALASALWVTCCALNDPVDQRVLAKLERLEQFREDESTVRVVRAWLNKRLTEKNRRPWVILLLKQFVKLFYRHRLVGVEKLREDETNPAIFLANHGNLYGPIAAWVFLPKPVRPWSISNMMTDLQETIDYLYKYTFSHVKAIPERLRLPVTKVMSRFSHWGLKALDAVPVYRDHLSKLILTFRQSVDVLKNGDNLLIFPENPNAVAQDHGYELHGVGELFSGFTMLAPIYYQRTGKCCRFIPVYSHQKSRTIAFGDEIVYDPQREDIEERDRLVREISESMNRLADELETAWQQKKKRA